MALNIPLIKYELDKINFIVKSLRKRRENSKWKQRWDIKNGSDLEFAIRRQVELRELVRGHFELKSPIKD